MPNKARQHKPKHPLGRSRREANANKRGYTYRWQRESKAHLREHPLCEECRRNGRITRATCVDHVKPHKGDQVLFWDPTNWQSLCDSCHSRKTATEDGGFGRAGATR